MRITSSGNVGIGTTAPTYSLQILQDNTGAYPGDNTTGQLVISDATDFTKNFDLNKIQQDILVKFKWEKTGTTTYPLILNCLGCNVGNGTTSPSYTLDVSGAGRFTGGLTIATSTPGS